MPYINNVEIAGNLGQDAKSSTTKSGKQVTRFSIASNKMWTDKTGKEHETTDWFRVAAWGSLTKFANSLKQGDPVLVKGELRTSKYTDDEGVTRETVEVVAKTLLRIDYSKVAIAERGDAYEPDEAA
jgi:single-strand DNA-binding protein